MRVVQLLTQYDGGPVDHAVDVAEELARRGHDSHIVGPAGTAVRKAQGAGVVWHDLAMSSKTDVRGAVAVSRALMSLRPDILHCQDRRAGLIGRTVGTVARLPATVYTLHGVADGLSDLVEGNIRAAPRRRRDAWYYLKGERWLSAASRSRVVVPSATVARFAIEHVRLPSDVVDVVHNGVDHSRFVPTDSRPGPVTAVWLGVMAPVKRLDVLIDALAEVPGLHARLVGDGPEREQIKGRIAAAGLTGRLMMRPRVDDPAGELGSADLFVLTSAAENCPLALLQAMSCGLPVVATRVGGIPEVVRHDVDGLLVPPADPAALAVALRSLTHDPTARARLGASGRQRIQQAYSLDSCVDGLLATYEKASACTS